MIEDKFVTERVPGDNLILAQPRTETKLVFKSHQIFCNTVRIPVYIRSWNIISSLRHWRSIF